MDPVRHNTARVALVDSDGRVLLQAVQNEATSPLFWLTPGGGTEQSESLADAAVREIREETGFELDPAAITEPLAVFDSAWSFRDMSFFGSHALFFVRVAHFEVDPSGQDAFEREVIREWRWWSEDELASTSQQIEPPEVGELLGRFLRGEIPPSPIRLATKPADTSRPC